MTRFYLRVDVEEDYDMGAEVTHTTVSLMEILEENEAGLKKLGYITPKAIKLQEKLGKVPSTELLCVPTVYTRSAESSLGHLTRGNYTLCLKVDPLTVLEGDNLIAYKKEIDKREKAAKLAESKKRDAAKKKKERELAKAKKLLQEEGLIND
jgi:hypothetical protein